MIGISKLYCGTVEASDPLRYGRHSKSLPAHLLQFSSDKKPVVVWNCTRACNLRCIHCYARAVQRSNEGELLTGQGLTLIDDLASFLFYHEGSYGLADHPSSSYVHHKHLVPLLH